MPAQPSFTVTFWGAARTATGSMHHVSVGGRDYLLECGMFQGRRQQAYQRNKEIPFEASKLTSMVLSHAHIDHSGNLPNLHRSGYNGPIFATPPTIDLCGPMLADSARIQEHDAEFLAKRIHSHKKLGVEDPREIVPPLYTEEDAKALMPQFRALPLGETREIGPGLSCRLSNAGHMLGSANVLLETAINGETRRLLFSGDIGRAGLPIIRDPDPAPAADYVIMESTYGNRVHDPPQQVGSRLAEIVRRVLGRGGHIVTPAFAVGRTQQLVLMLHELIQSGELAPFPIFVDSPLAINVTEVFRKHPEEYDAEAQAFSGKGQDPFGFERLRYLRDATDSKALNDLRVPYMVIASSGMCEGGRVLHHLRNSVENPRNLILLTGYQAEDTLGRKIANRQPEIPIFGEPLRLRAEVAAIDELSGHADKNELLEWLRPIAPNVRRVFLVHGEPDAQGAFQKTIEDELHLPVHCSTRGEIFRLD
jgi:metallo-beta-lactamase family protein